LKNSLVAVLLIVVLLASGALGYTLAGGHTTLPVVSISTTTAIVTVTIMRNTFFNQTFTTSVNSFSNKCTPDPYGKAVFIELVYDNGTRIAGNSTNNGLSVDESPVQVCNGMTVTIAIIFNVQLNQTGIASLNPAEDYASFYIVHVHYAGKVYDITAPTESNKTTLVIVSIPSGKTNTTYS